MRILVLLALILAMFSVSCSGLRDEKIDQETKIKQLLNDGRSEEAIILLKNELETRPEDQDLLFLLSTAYASRGNVDIYTLYPVLEINLFNKPAIEWGNLKSDWNPYVDYLTDGAIVYGAEDPDYNEKLKIYLDSILTFTWGIYEMFPIIGLTPYLDDFDRAYIDKSIAILLKTEFTGQRKHEAMLYRSLLSAVQIVTLIKDILHIRDMIDLKDKSLRWFICRIDLKHFSRGVLSRLAAYGSLFTEGLAITDFVNKDFEKLYEITNELWEASQHSAEFDHIMKNAKKVLDDNFICKSRVE